MERNKVLAEIKKYFKIQEFVDEPTFKRWSENAWNFIDTALLETVLVLRRDILKVPMVINDWSWGGKNSQRGLRTNISPMVKKKPIRVSCIYHNIVLVKQLTSFRLK